VQVTGNATHLAHALERFVRRARIYQQDPHLRFTIDFANQVLKTVLDRVLFLEHEVNLSDVFRRNTPLRPAIQVAQYSTRIGNAGSYELPD
jgi:GAF domain-containing protein